MWVLVRPETTTLVITIVTSIGLLDLAVPQVPWIPPEEQGRPILLLLLAGGKTVPQLVVLTMLPALLVKGTFPAAAVEAP